MGNIHFCLPFICHFRLICWARIINIALGIWLMAAPATLGYSGVAATNHYIVGPLIVSSAAIALAQVTRPVRWVNVPLGLWLIVSPLVLGYEAGAYLNGLIVGVVVSSLALFKGKVNQRFGGGWSNIWRRSGFPPEEQPELS